MAVSTTNLVSQNPILSVDVSYKELTELALDLRWSWTHATEKIWQRLGGELWDSTKNPWVVLQAVGPEKLRNLLEDSSFTQELAELVQAKKLRGESATWFQKSHPKSPLKQVAYFSMEFMLSEALPIYSGGLGNVAGDQLKACSDLGVPVVGVGLLYQQGYFRQMIDKDGSQRAIYPFNNPGQLPITPLRRENGEWLRIEVELPGCSVWLRAWQAQVGEVRLYLLDSNDVANLPAHRLITGELYGGGPEMRLKQELILGIGGWRLLRELGIRPDVCHLNEGHAAFAVLERARCFMEESGQTFEVALAVTRSGNLFTTHTAVAAGFDRFEPEMIVKHLGDYAETRLGLTVHDLLALGRQNADDSSEPFNMAYLAIRGSGAVNGVSRLHGEVSRTLFSSLFPRWPVSDVPVTHVTNGVHMPTWDSVEADQLWTEACGKDRWLGKTDLLGKSIQTVSDTKIWEFRTAARTKLIEKARKRLTAQFAVSGADPREIVSVNKLFDPGVMTLGFARRFASYKRPNLLLLDQERLRRLLTNPEHSVQLMIAGKAHPEDQGGQDLIREWIQFIRQPEIRPHVIFLGDYDMQLAQELVQGVDVWINTPRRPWEACGTSGMKVLVNGGINISELDGWWAEAYFPDLGWAIGDGAEHGDDPAWDRTEAGLLFDALEHEVLPEFYDRRDGVSSRWVARIRESMSRLTPQFSATRAVIDYTEKHYVQAASAYQIRAAHSGERAKQLAAWQHSLKENWSKIRFGEVRLKAEAEHHIFEVEVNLGDLSPDSVVLEMYADGIVGMDPVRQEMKLVSEKSRQACHLYMAAVSAHRPPVDYTARIMPKCEGVLVPLEASQILWQR